jgi:RNA polymerase sigma factor (sigma-70 family)
MAEQPTPRRDPDRNAPLVDYLARERYGWLAALAQRWGADPDSVDDVVQSALLDVLRSFPGPHERSYVVAYAARCVRNRVFKLHRRHSRKESRNAPLPSRESSDRLGSEEELGLADPSAPGPFELLLSSESRAEARELLARLPEQELTILLLIAAGYSHAEVSELTGLSPRTIRKRVNRANRRLAEPD